MRDLVDGQSDRRNGDADDPSTPSRCRTNLRARGDRAHVGFVLVVGRKTTSTFEARFIARENLRHLAANEPGPGNFGERPAMSFMT